MIAAPSPPLHFAQVLLPSNQGSVCVPFIFMPHNCVGYACDREVFPLLERHYRWLRRTQAGPSATSFRWRGCTKDHSFASGLDDYPRGVVSACRGGGVSPLALDVLSSVGARQHEVGVLARQSPCHNYPSTLLLDVLFVVQVPKPLPGCTLRHECVEPR